MLDLYLFDRASLIKSSDNSEANCSKRPKTMDFPLACAKTTASSIPDWKQVRLIYNCSCIQYTH